jgi:hypothetical protein
LALPKLSATDLVQGAERTLPFLPVEIIRASVIKILSLQARIDVSLDFHTGDRGNASAA